MVPWRVNVLTEERSASNKVGGKARVGLFHPLTRKLIALRIGAGFERCFAISSRSDG